MTADAATRAIRAGDAEGLIGLISKEPHPPYDRPPLTKGLWKGEKMGSIWRETSDARVTLHLNRTVDVLDAERKRVVDTEGEVYTFDKLLLATGGRPRRLPFDHRREDTIYYRTLEDYLRLSELAERKQRFAVVGAGFIGSELAAGLVMNDKDVVMAFPEAGISALRFPQDLAEFLNEYYRERGVEILAGSKIVSLERNDDGVVLETDDGEEIVADVAIAGLGIVPNVELAAGAGLETDNGIVVDEFLRTSQPDIYAAGDVAAFHDVAMGIRRRVEHEDNALSMGAMAGRSMTGDPAPYDHTPFFYSDLFDLGYEAVGQLDAGLETFSDWQEPYRKGVVYYLDEGRVRGVLLWNVWDQVEAATALLAETGPFEPQDLKGRLPE
jgi:NADPH-dependent 2,4-dienoyl-CoA reductase/sulfur reductase-like enzyme